MTDPNGSPAEDVEVVPIPTHRYAYADGDFTFIFHGSGIWTHDFGDGPPPNPTIEEEPHDGV